MFNCRPTTKGVRAFTKDQEEKIKLLFEQLVLLILYFGPNQPYIPCHEDGLLNAVLVSVRMVVTNGDILKASKSFSKVSYENG